MDWEKIGLKVGLEIHQQLDSQRKLFCRCPNLLRNDEPDIEIKRKLHAVKGESGEVDVAVKFEVSKEREFIYQGYSDTNCLLEYDECPPYLIDHEALQIALHISMLLNCDVIPISQIMRKTVVDGSNTGGFQRTVLIARNGYIDTSYGKVRIENVSLEEDSARPVNRDKTKVIYKLDRLGVPLVEIGTYPDITSPEMAKEAAMKLGDILRSCKVKRGIGTIRQDINISIKDHPRIEIKGFQDIKMFIPVILNEVKRQEENLKSKNLNSEVRAAQTTGTTKFLRPMPGSARMYPETDLPLLKISREMINHAKKTLPKSLDQIREFLRKKGLNDSQIKVLTKKSLVEEFKTLLYILDEPKFVYQALIEIPIEVKKHLNKKIDIENTLTTDIIEKIITEVKNKKLDKGLVKHVMEDIVKGKPLKDAIKIETADTSKIETTVAKIIKQKPGLSHGAYMGLIMKEFKGKITGKEASDILNKIMK